MRFWEKPQGAAVFKHTILRQYAPIFANKVGKYSEAHSVEIIDGYAGQGRYDNGDPGSPEQFLETARALRKNRTVHCTFIEADVKTHAKLCQLLKEAEATERDATVLRGTMSQHLDGVLAASRGVPVFAFIDPFGFGLTFDEMVGKLMARPRAANGKWAPTEVLVNFIRAGVYRQAARRAPKTADPTQLAAGVGTAEQMDRWLGGAWWRDLAETIDDTDTLVSTIRDQYIERVLTAAGEGWMCLQVRVADHISYKPVFDLLFFTQSQHGRWFFNDAVTRGREIFTSYCEPGQENVLPLWSPQEDRVSEIAANLRQLLADKGAVSFLNDMPAVYGDLLGRASGPDAKKAARRVVEDGRADGELGEPHTIVLRATRSAHAPAS